MKTPLHPLHNISKDLGINLTVKRDDLLPYYGGGNKVRKMLNIYPDIERSRASVIITNGGVESNHARVCALLAAEKGLKCHLVLHGERVKSPFCNGNGALMSFAGANIDYCRPEEIAEIIAQRKDEYEREGKIVYVVPGGAHSVLGAESYANAVNELEIQPDYIVVASGTGATHAGLHFGSARRFGESTKVIGISVARSSQRGTQVVLESIDQLKEIAKCPVHCPEVVFKDDWTEGGYGVCSERIFEIIQYALKKDGFILDPVYTGKAFLGLFQLVLSGGISQNQNVLFWHTGGLLNLQSSGRVK